MSVQRIGVVLATAATVAAFGLCATRDFARSTPTIDPAPDTPLGRITAHTIGRIIPTSDLSFNMFFPRVERLAGGEWVVSGDEGAGHIQVFRSINSAPQKVGRAGGGPGEFDSPRQVLPDSAGGMLVFDEVALRFTRFDSNLQFVESFHHTHPFPWDIVQRSRDTLFINAMDWTQEGIGYNLFVGVPGKDFFPVGSKDLTYLPGESAKFGMPIVAGDAGTIWGAPSTRHRLLQFGREGELVDSLDLGSSWFAAWTGSRGGFDTEYPRPYVVDLHRDKAGHLWILTHVAAAGWKPPRLPWLSRAKSGEGRPRLKPLEREAYLASVIEVVDPDRREVLAAIRLEPLFAGFASDGTLYRLTEDAPDGGFAIELTAVRYDPGQQGLANTGREHQEIAMRRMPLLVATILGGVALIVANPLVGRAAEEDASVCKECTNHSGDEHHFHLGLPTGQHQGLPNAHHLNLQDGSCNNWHNQCTSGQASAFDARFKSIQDFAEELKSMPADDILALQSEFDLFVRVSDDGRQLFLVGCNDQVIAALPVGLQAVSSLASRA